MPNSGVYPVHNNVFKINTMGRSGTETGLVIIKDLTTFGIAIEGTNEEWFPLDQEGWARQANTGKKMSISFSGKRSFGDPGNDYVAGMMTKTGKDCETAFEWTLPDGSKLAGDCVINLTNPGGGDSTALMALEFELLVDGKPTYTAATA
jgi:hypothetical protein